VVHEGLGPRADQTAQSRRAQDRYVFDEVRRDGTGSESETKETRAREDQIKNLPRGQMQILMDDPVEGTKYSHLLVRRDPDWELPGMSPRLYPKLHSWIDPTIGAHLRFSERKTGRDAAGRSAPCWENSYEDDVLTHTLHVYSWP
jgi:hypothetical protein